MSSITTITPSVPKCPSKWPSHCSFEYKIHDLSLRSTCPSVGTHINFGGRLQHTTKKTLTSSILLPAKTANVPDTNLRLCAIYTGSFYRRLTDMFVLSSRKNLQLLYLQFTKLPTKSTTFFLTCLCYIIPLSVATCLSAHEIMIREKVSYYIAWNFLCYFWHIINL